MMGKKKPMPMKKGVMPAGMYADGGMVKGKPMKKMADGGMVGSNCGPGYVPDWSRKDMKK
jgi:hypothetical protein